MQSDSSITACATPGCSGEFTPFLSGASGGSSQRQFPAWYQTFPSRSSPSPRQFATAPILLTSTSCLSEGRHSARCMIPPIPDIAKRFSRTFVSPEPFTSSEFCAR